MDTSFLAHVSCGLFGISDDYIEKYQSLDSRFIKNKASTFFFSAASDSMEPLITEGDVLVVDRSIEAMSGRIAVVCLGGEMLCKRVIKHSGQVILRSDNPLYKDIKITEEMDLVVFGVVTAIVRELI
ncbi:MAG: S24 family peptidase [Bdellovibrionales bacterium]|nr:S24 family peptidase [Bdellovibrionales bacterium]